MVTFSTGLGRRWPELVGADPARNGEEQRHQAQLLAHEADSWDLV